MKKLGKIFLTIIVLLTALVLIFNEPIKVKLVQQVSQSRLEHLSKIRFGRIIYETLRLISLKSSL